MEESSKKEDFEADRLLDEELEKIFHSRDAYVEIPPILSKIEMVDKATEADLESEAIAERDRLANKLNDLQASNNQLLQDIEHWKSESQQRSDVEMSLKETIAKLEGEMGTLKNTMEEMKRDSVTTIEEINSKTMKEIASLTQKYHEEYELRKKYYNQLLELKGNIRVFCRVRPMNDNEQASSENLIDYISENTLIYKQKKYEFDHVFNYEADQATVFAEVRPIVLSVMDGFNACIFAYGATGAGKTYTMEGPENDRGVNIRAMQELFNLVAERGSTHKYTIHVNMVEIYNEQIRDLLCSNSADKKNLDVKKQLDGSMFIPDLTEVKVENMDDVWQVMKVGQRNRAVSATDCNEHSSRSHSLLRISIVGENRHTGVASFAKLSLIDLAGSERLAKSMVTGDRLKEAQHINKSLSALGNVVSALVAKNSHIPYRDSKLTYLLSDSLGGDAKTLMILQISSSSMHESETVCSLGFGVRVRSVENAPAKQHLDTNFVKMREEAKKSKEEMAAKDKLIDQLQERLRLAEEKTQKLESMYNMTLKKERETLLRVSTVSASLKKAEDRIMELETEGETLKASKVFFISPDVTSAKRMSRIPEEDLESPKSLPMDISIPGEIQVEEPSSFDVWNDSEGLSSNASLKRVKTVRSVRFAESPQKSTTSLNTKRKAEDTLFTSSNTSAITETTTTTATSSCQAAPVKKTLAKRIQILQPLAANSPFQDKPSFSTTLRKAASSATVASNTNAPATTVAAKGRAQQAQRIQVSTPKTSAKRIRIIRK